MRTVLPATAERRRLALAHRGGESRMREKSDTGRPKGTLRALESHRVSRRPVERNFYQARRRAHQRGTRVNAIPWLVSGF